MLRRHFLALAVTSTVATLLPHALLAQGANHKAESYIALAQEHKIVLLKPSGEVLREITPTLPADFRINYLSASADGSLLCFDAGGGWLGSNDLTTYVVNSDGSNLRAIKPQSELRFHMPCLSSDGKLISCRAYAKDSDLYVMDLDGKVRDLGTSTAGAGESHFSRDGKTIFFVIGADLWRIPVEGGNAESVLRRYYPAPFDVNLQNTSIAVVPVDNFVSNLATISPQGELKNLPGLPVVSYSGVVWSPDGKQFVFTRAHTSMEAKDGGTFIASANDPKPRRLSEDYRASHSLVWR